jgi:SAM-dependent methyltransferase
MEGAMNGIFKESKAIIRRSVEERGLTQTLKHVATRGPLYLKRIVGELLDARRPASEFDRRYGVQTDSDRGEATPLRTFRIASPNWMQGTDYAPVVPRRFYAALSALRVPVDGYTFVDFGSGKGRAVLMASEYPFRELIGIDFSPELTAIAERNWSVYRNPRQRCATAHFVCEDFLNYEIPQTPAVLYFYHPCGEALLAKVAARIADAATGLSEPVAILYVNPIHTHVWAAAGFQRAPTSPDAGCDIYGNAAWIERLNALV